MSHSAKGQRLTVAGLTKRRQLHQIILRNGFQWLSGLAPCGQPSNDHERAESFFPQYMRHPGAGCFARSSTVEINILVFRKIFELFLEIVGFDANRTMDPLRSDVIITMTPYVDDQYAVCLPRRQARC